MIARRLSALVASIVLALAPNLALAQAAQWSYTQPAGANSLATYPGDVTINGALNATGGGAGVFASLKNGVTGWLTPIYPSSESLAIGESLSGTGAIGWLSASQCSKNPHTDDMRCIGSSAVVINDNSVNPQFAWGRYTESRRYAGAGTTHGQEINAINLGSLVSAGPYSLQSVGDSGLTSGLWLASGRSDVVGSTDVSCAICVVNNSATFDTGIVFDNLSLQTVSGVKLAMLLGKDMTVAWQEPATSAIRGLVRSAVTTAAGRGGQLVFSDNGTDVLDDVGTLRARFNAANNVGAAIADHIQSTSSTTAPTLGGTCGTSPSMGSLSTDARINATMGSGTVTSCQITFALAYQTANPPVCVVSTTSTAIIAAITAVSVNNVTIGFSANAAGVTIYVHCLQ